MKKVLIMMVVFALALAAPLSLTACGGATGNDAPDAAASDTDAVQGPEIGPGPIVTDKTFKELDAALESFGLDRDKTVAEDVAAFLGVYGEEKNWDDEKIAISWYACDDGFATIFFYKETGLYSSWSTSDMGRPE
ncbi:MAG: hypothetical protein LBP91_06075 [Coriobacteriales bacterium]|jgi:hypothetical protein|nr:hypothetical protein [Coriobacteriales bacterium]